MKVKSDPWSTILVNERERYSGTHVWRSRASEFMINGVYEKTGLSLTQFLKLPTYMVEHILSTLRQLGKETRSGARDVERDLEKQSEEFLNMKKR